MNLPVPLKPVLRSNLSGAPTFLELLKRRRKMALGAFMVDVNSLSAVEGNNLVNREYVAPRSKAERIAASIWEKVLGDWSIGINQPFYALQAQGMFSDCSSLDTVEKMADHYITEILAIQPQGPYRLGGWSMGGLEKLNELRKCFIPQDQVTV